MLKNVIFSLKAHSTTHQKGRLGNWERMIGNFSGRRLFVKGSKVMLLLGLGYNLTIYTSKIFVTLAFIGPVQFVPVSGSKSKLNWTC